MNQHMDFHHDSSRCQNMTRYSLDVFEVLSIEIFDKRTVSFDTDFMYIAPFTLMNTTTSCNVQPQWSVCSLHTPCQLNETSIILSTK